MYVCVCVCQGVETAGPGDPGSERVQPPGEPGDLSVIPNRAEREEGAAYSYGRPRRDTVDRPPDLSALVGAASRRSDFSVSSGA